MPGSVQAEFPEGNPRPSTAGGSNYPDDPVDIGQNAVEPFYDFTTKCADGADIWREMIESGGASEPGESNFSMDGESNATLVGIVDWADRYAVLLGLIGASWVDSTGSVPQLRRVPPLSHPYWDWLQCRKVQIKGMAALPSRTSGGPAGSPNLADYKYARITATFESLPFDTLEDFEILNAQGIPDESMRYVEFLQGEAHANFLAGSGIQMKYVEGPLQNRPFPAEYGPLKAESMFTLVWRNVPKDWVFNASAGGFAHLQEAIATVNKNAFFGYPPQTVLLTTPRYKQKRAPIKVTGSGELYLLDVELPFVVTAPPSFSPASAYAGHNLVPYYDGDATFGWAGGGFINKAGGIFRGKYQMWDYANIFRSAAVASNPALPSGPP